MAELYLVDTSAWVFSLRRRPNQAILRRIDALFDQGTIATCGAIELELLAGAVSPQEFDRLEARLSGPRRLSTEEGDWKAAARLAFSLLRIGITVGSVDLLLAALAIRHNAVLVHADRDFDLVAAHSDLRVESLVQALSGP